MRLSAREVADAVKLLRSEVCFASVLAHVSSLCSKGTILHYAAGIIKEPLNKSSAAADGSFAPAMQFEKLEIHPVFLRFPNFYLWQNLSPSALADLIRASLENVK